MKSIVKAEQNSIEAHMRVDKASDNIAKQYLMHLVEFFIL